MIRLTVELVPHGDETQARVIARGRICNLRHHPAGSPVGDFHAFFEAVEPPMASNPPPYQPDDPRAVDHMVASTYADGVERFTGSVWDLVAVMLEAGGRGRAIVGGERRELHRTG